MTIIQEPYARLIVTRLLSSRSYSIQAGILYLPSTEKANRAELSIDEAELPNFRIVQMDLPPYYLNNFITRGVVILPEGKLYNAKAKIWTTRGVYETETVLINTTGKPTAPRNLTASLDIDQQLITLNWLPPLSWGRGSNSPGSTTADSPEKYEISHYLISNPNTVYRTVTSPIFTSYSFPLATFAPNQKYGFYITAFNKETKIPSPPSNVAQIDTSSPTAFKLFDRSSWNNRTDIPTNIKNQLNKAEDSWEQFIKINVDLYKRLQFVFPRFKNGIYLKNINIVNDPTKSAVACVPNETIQTFKQGTQNGIVTASFSMRLNAYYFYRLTDYDWELAFTHHLGHALGLGFVNRGSFSRYPTYQLNGEQFPNAQGAYNSRKIPSFKKDRKFIPLDHLGPETTDNNVGFDGTPSTTDSVPPEASTGSLYWHWGLLRNKHTRFTSLHPTSHINNDIMGYRYPNQDKVISLLSIKALVDLGYEEVQPNSYQIKSANIPYTTITNKQLCSGLNGSVVNGKDIMIASTDTTASNKIEICGVYEDEIIIDSDTFVDVCKKWYCEPSGCVDKYQIEVFEQNKTGYDTFDECEENCTDSAEMISMQYVFDTLSKTWRSR
jgi:hypothetical protein